MSFSLSNLSFKTDTQPPHALEANVTVISHKECFQMLLDILINRESERTAILVAFPQGLTKQTICTKGIFNEEKGLYTVIYICITMRFLLKIMLLK